ncbi:MAG: hypothetical protein E6Q97_28830 [Desulfurellales bacterium]|nr:MAG: hypothetical protein E6Q97_28830 [Desulfurellales bacterium]
MLTATATAPKLPKIAFPANGHAKGDLVRYFHAGFRFWKIYKVKNGQAFAMPVADVSSNSDGVC